MKQLLEESPADRPNIKTVCHIHDLHMNMRSSVAKEEQPKHNSATKLSSQDGGNRSRKESGSSSVSSPSTSTSDKQKKSSAGAQGTGQVEDSSSGAKSLPSDSNQGMISYEHV